MKVLLKSLFLGSLVTLITVNCLEVGASESNRISTLEQQIQELQKSVTDLEYMTELNNYLVGHCGKNTAEDAANIRRIEGKIRFLHDID